MEYLPDLYTKVIYPKDTRIRRKTLFGIKLYKLDEKLIIKLPNEFKHCMRGYNPYNLMDYGARFHTYIDDYNNYSTF